MKKLTLALVAAAGVWAGPLAAQAPPVDNQRSASRSSGASKSSC
jgi:hypothetical protein